MEEGTRRRWAGGRGGSELCEVRRCSAAPWVVVARLLVRLASTRLLRRFRRVAYRQGQEMVLASEHLRGAGAQTGGAQDADGRGKGRRGVG